MSTLHAKNALIFALVMTAALPFGPRVALGVALGGSLQLLNLRLLERSVAYMLGLAGAGQGGAVQALIGLRFVALMGACAYVLIALPVDPLGFAIGFSVTVPAVLWHGLMSAREA
jgi:hypothetical protein